MFLLSGSLPWIFSSYSLYGPSLMILECLILMAPSRILQVSLPLGSFKVKSSLGQFLPQIFPSRYFLSDLQLDTLWNQYSQVSYRDLVMFPLGIQSYSWGYIPFLHWGYSSVSIGNIAMFLLEILLCFLIWVYMCFLWRHSPVSNGTLYNNYSL